jgi:hypothetical protein
LNIIDPHLPKQKAHPINQVSFEYFEIISSFDADLSIPILSGWNWHLFPHTAQTFICHPERSEG